MYKKIWKYEDGEVPNEVQRGMKRLHDFTYRVRQAEPIVYVDEWKEEIKTENGWIVVNRDVLKEYSDVYDMFLNNEEGRERWVEEKARDTIDKSE